MVDGRVVAAVEEERLTGRRHAPGEMPHQAAAWALAGAKLALADVDVVALGWDPALQPDAPEPTADADLLDLLLPRPLFPRRSRPVLRRVPHHQAHAAAAWATSGFGDAAVLVVDGSGERESVSGWQVADGALRPLWSLPFAASLGFFYLALTQHAGFAMFEEGKTMGLAGWGEPRWELPSPLDLPVAAPAPPTAEHYRQIVAGWRRLFRTITGLPPNPKRPATNPATGTTARRAQAFPQPYRDLAASGQHRLTADLVVLARRVLRETGAPALCVAGGVGLNCVANGAVERAVAPVSYHVQPACHDAGVALGAAVVAGLDAGAAPLVDDGHVYTGPAFPPGPVADLLAGWGLPVAATADPLDEVARRLAAGQVVAVFDGGAEFGPRALGARSVLADPSSPGMLDRVNGLKRREPWRPLGPSLTEQAAAEVFGGPVSGPFMLVAHPVPDRYAGALRAVVHADGTTRPQVVRPSLRPVLHELLSRFTALTGVPGLVNTSFNVAGPIVAAPQQAVATFMTSGLDALLIEGHLVVKR